MSLKGALFVPDPVPEDFKPNRCYEAQGTNGQKGLVWVVQGTANWEKTKGGAKWSELGYEFDTEVEARKFYRQHRKPLKKGDHILR